MKPTMKSICKLFVAFALILSFNASANEGMSIKPQGNEPYKVFKDWFMHIETKDHIEISSRIVQCEMGGGKQIHLLIFNEAEAKTFRFELTVTNSEDNKTFTREITVKAARAQMFIASCDNTDKVLNQFKIDLPVDYNPEKTTVTVAILN